MSASLTGPGGARVVGGALPPAVFLLMFGWTSVWATLPFYVHELTPHDPVAALHWTGWILGISPLATMITTPVWVRVASANPVRWYAMAQVIQGLCFVAMVPASSLLTLLLARLVLGASGPAATYAFIIAARRGSPGLAREMAVMQSTMTLGQVFGPLAGALTVTHHGYAASFLLAAVSCWASAALVFWGVPRLPAASPAVSQASSEVRSWLEIARICLLALIGYSEVQFLSAVLPDLLPRLGVPAIEGVQVAGWITFLSGLALALGALVAAPLAARVGARRAVLWSFAASAICVGALALVWRVELLTAVRVLHVLLLAPALPLVMARAAQGNDGQAIGFANSARIGAYFVGPIVATSLLASMSPSFVFAVFALAGLAALSPASAWPREDQVAEPRPRDQHGLSGATGR